MLNSLRQVYRRVASLPTGVGRPFSTRLRRAQLLQTRSPIVTAAKNSRSTKKKVLTQYDRLHQVDEDYWADVRGALRRERAVHMGKYVHPEWPLGVQPHVGTQIKDYHLGVKKYHPRHVSLVRVGEFYEAVGMDAVLLMEFCALNPMGSPDKASNKDEFVPRAGCRVEAVVRVLKDLTTAGFHVAVSEEYGPAYQTKSTKERYIAQVVSPSQPSYEYAPREAKAFDQSMVDFTPPLVGISVTSKSGYDVIFVHLATRQCRIYHGCTADAAFAHLHRTRMVWPLYVPENVQRLTAGSKMDKSEAQQVIAQAKALVVEQGGHAATYAVVGGQNPYEALLTHIKHDNGLKADDAFELFTASITDRPRPLSRQTAHQLGLYPESGIPPLIVSCVNNDLSIAAQRWLLGLLLQPPTPAIRADIWTINDHLSKTGAGVPDFAVLTQEAINNKLQRRSGDWDFFHLLTKLLDACYRLLRDPAHTPLLAPLLRVAQAHSRLTMQPEQLKRTLRACLDSISDVVEPPPSNYANHVRSMKAAGTNTGLTTHQQDLLSKYYQQREVEFEGIVKPACWQQAYGKLQTVRQHLDSQLAETLSRVKSHAEVQGPKQRGKGTEIVLAITDSGIWLKGTKQQKCSKIFQQLDYAHATKKGKPDDTLWTSEELRRAVEDYNEACEDAAAAVKEALQQLCDKLLVDVGCLMSASIMSTVLSCLQSHCALARRKGWQPADWQCPEAAAEQLKSIHEAASSGDGVQGGDAIIEAAEATTLSLEGVWPYWMDRGPQENDVQLHSIAILTGPNMAGKSTILRSTAAVALLAQCGFMVPARSANVPAIDGIELRTFHGDAPAEGKSAWAMEMHEMHRVLQCSTRATLVLVDELGKGTEASAGGAILAAIALSLQQRGAIGIFATHLHAVLGLPDMAEPPFQHLQMETQAHSVGNGLDVLRPTNRMVPGISTESLAVDVARANNINEDICQAASRFQQELADGLVPVLSQAHHHPASSNGTSNVTAAPAMPNSSQQNCSASATDGSAAVAVESAPSRDVPALVAEILCSAAESLDPDSGHQPPSVQVLEHGDSPPARAAGMSAVYVWHSNDGWSYCGQTDDLHGRVRTHRSTNSTRKLMFVYVCLPGSLQGASAARQIEARTITALSAAGVELISKHDARTQHRAFA